MKRNSGRKPLRIKLGTFSLNKNDLINIEKIIKKRLKHTDFYITVGREKGWFNGVDYEFTSARRINKNIGSRSHVKIINKVPNISVRFSPLSTTIMAQRHFYKDDDLKSINKTAYEVQKYLMASKKTIFLNKITF